MKNAQGRTALSQFFSKFVVFPEFLRVRQTLLIEHRTQQRGEFVAAVGFAQKREGLALYCVAMLPGLPVPWNRHGRLTVTILI